MPTEMPQAIEFSFNISDALMILAILLAPVIAVQVDKYLERERENKRGKLWVFKTLMATRGKLLDPEHVKALNMIDLEFVGNEYKAVCTEWKSMLNHFESAPNPPQIGAEGYEALKSSYDTEYAIWNNKTTDYQAKLLFEMGTSLGYSFDQTHIKKATYLPQAHVDLLTEQNLLRKGLLDMISGKVPISMEIKNWPTNKD